MDDCKKKVIFLIFQDLPHGNGITKKILSQKKALEENGLYVELCYYSFQDGQITMHLGSSYVNLGNGIRGKLNFKYNFKPLFDYIVQNDFNYLYVRYLHNANPFLISFFKRLKKRNIKTVLEIPTYPYDQEYSYKGIINLLNLKIEKYYRLHLKNCVERIVTFSPDEYIYDIKTIKIANGVNFDGLKLKEKKIENNRIVLLGVAQIRFWHGYDRLIKGLKNYYVAGGKENIQFNIVGDGDPEDIGFLKTIIEQENLKEHVHLLGKLEGANLDNVFNECDLAVGCLGCHRKGIINVRSLKNIEYAARGIPFIYSEENEDFDNKEYVLKFSPDETHIDVNKLVEFIKSKEFSPDYIKKSVFPEFSWNNQMANVADYIIAN